VLDNCYSVIVNYNSDLGSVLFEFGQANLAKTESFDETGHPKISATEFKESEKEKLK